MKSFFSLAVIGYIASVVILNMGFAYVPMIETQIGMLSPMAVLAGLVFVLRDFAQRAAGHGVILAMVIATGLSYFLADPYVALASAAAFATAELADYLIYTFTKKPFHHRIMLSSIVSTPIDTVVFLYGISAFTVGTFILMVAAKLVAALVIWMYYAGREEFEDEDEREPDWSDPFPGDSFRVPLEGQKAVAKPYQPRI